MAVRLTVGLQRKIGLPDYGSLGASCSVEIEIDRSVFESNGFQDRVNLAFSQCRTAVDQQLATAKGPPQLIDAHVNPAGKAQDTLNAAQQVSSFVPISDSKPKLTPATYSQLRAIFGIARRLGLDPQQLVAERFNVQSADQLNIRQASQLIDGLKRMPQEIPS
jgi:hypothetical protein